MYICIYISLSLYIYIYMSGCHVNISWPADLRRTAASSTDAVLEIV